MEISGNQDASSGQCITAIRMAHRGHVFAKEPADVAALFGEGDNVKALEGLVGMMEPKGQMFDNLEELAKQMPGGEVGHEIQ